MWLFDINLKPDKVKPEPYFENWQKLDPRPDLAVETRAGPEPDYLKPVASLSTIQLNNINHSFEWFWIMWKILFMKPLKIKPYLSRYIHEEIWHDICCHYFTNPEGNTPANSLPFFYRVKVKLCKNIIFLLHYVIIIVT